MAQRSPCHARHLSEVALLSFAVPARIRAREAYSLPFLSATKAGRASRARSVSAMDSEFFIPASPGQFPTAAGYFGAFGGKFIPEALVAAVDEVAIEYERAKTDPGFAAELEQLLVHYAGRPSALTEVSRFAAQAGGARVFLKREDLNHTGSHKINNVLGQALLSRRMGKPRVIAETGAGSHGVA